METSDDQAVQQRANQLYWDSEDSVNQIADELELSKGALYGLVQPLPSGLPCPRCSTEMEYPNRTARDKGYLSCPACDLEEGEAEVRLEWREAARGSPTGALVVNPGSGASAAAGPGSGDALKRLLLGSALLGAAAGVVVTLWVRRK